MADIFDSILNRSTPADNRRQQEQTAGRGPAQGEGQTDYDRKGEEKLLGRGVIYGPDLRDTSVPLCTANASSHPVVTLPSPSGARFGMSDELLSRHLLILGGTGMGKSNVFYQITEQTMRSMPRDSVMLIFDTKGDFRRRFYQPHNPDHILIGNEEIYRGCSLAWNLFDEVLDAGGTSLNTLEIRLKEITAHLYRGRESETQPFFSMAAADLFVIFVFDYIVHKRGPFTNQALISALKRTDARGMMKIIEANDRFASARSYLGNPDKQTAQSLGILAYINSMVSDLFKGVFAEDRRAGFLAMDKIVRQGGRKKIFLEYDLSAGTVLGPMYSLLIDQALKAALAGQEDGRPHLYLVIDEFKLLPDLDHIEHALNYGRSKGIRVCAGIQSVSQIYEVYGREKGESILSGFMNCFAFKTIDRESREYTSERFGKNYSTINYISDTHYYSIQREGYAVEDWDILALDTGDAYIDLLGYPSFKFHFCEYPAPTGQS